MSTPDDNIFDLEGLNLPDDLSGPLKPSEESLPEQPGTEQAAAEATPAATSGTEQDKVELETKSTISKRSGSAVGKGESSQIRLKAATAMQRLKTADSFTVLLSLALVALVIAIFCCLVELGRYHFDLRAKGAKQAITMTTATEPLAQLSSRA